MRKPSLLVCWTGPAEKQLRRRLEGEFGVELSGRKALLRAQINAYLEEQASSVEGSGTYNLSSR